MLKRLILSLAFVASTLGFVAGTAAPAAADQRPCVSRAEYNNMVYYWGDPTIAKVRDHFDHWGSRLAADGQWGSRDEVWAFPKCREWGYGKVGVWFDDYSSDRYGMRLYAASPRNPWGLVDRMWNAIYG